MQAMQRTGIDTFISYMNIFSIVATDLISFNAPMFLQDILCPPLNFHNPLESHLYLLGFPFSYFHEQFGLLPLNVGS